MKNSLDHFTIASSTLALVIIFAAAAPQAQPLKSPSIVTIISDDHGWGDYSFMRHKHIRTPNLDRLASQSLVFTRG